VVSGAHGEQLAVQSDYSEVVLAERYLAEQVVFAGEESRKQEVVWISLTARVDLSTVFSRSPCEQLSISVDSRRHFSSGRQALKVHPF